MVWPNWFELNQLETNLSATVNRALYMLCLAREELKDICTRLKNIKNVKRCRDGMPKSM